MRHWNAKAALPLIAFVAGCFSLQPVDRLAPSVGAEVAVDLNEAGRTALAPALGPEVAQVQGHLLRRDGDADLLAVSSTRFVNGGGRTWAGETVHVRSDYTTRYYENRVSSKRSLVAGGILAGTIAVLTAVALQPTPTPDLPNGGVEGPGDKLRALPKTVFRFSPSFLGARRRAPLSVPGLTRH
jgi:hypothetical protein